MDLSKYKQVEYNELQKVLHKRKEEVDIHELKLAADVEVKSVSTVRNVFNYDIQSASDEVVTKVIKVLGIKAFVGWVDGERHYFLAK